MTEALLDNIADLLTVADVPRGDNRREASAARLVRLCKPLLLLWAAADGELIAAEDLEAGGNPEAAALAAEVAGHLAAKKACRLEVAAEAGPRLALAVRLPACAGREVLACLVEPGQLCQEDLGELETALLVCAVFAWAAIHNQSTDAHLRTRIKHLLAEHDALRLSHAEATCAAIEEREQRLRQQQEYSQQLRTVMMMAADGIVTIDENGIIESFNEAAGSIFGYAPDEVIGQNIAILTPPPVDWQQGPDLAECMRTGQTGPACFAGEVVGQRKDGTTFLLDMAVSRVSLGDRRIFSGIFRDITKRKKAEQELKRLHLQNEMILNSAGEGIVGVDQNRSVMFVNPAAARMLGWEIGELVGRPLQEFTRSLSLDEGLPSGHGRSSCNTVQPSAAPNMSQQVFWKKDGSSFPVEYTSTPIREGDQIVGSVVTFRDITERRMLEAQLRQAQKLESIGQLAAGIAHEINTPTQYIGDNTRFLEDAFRDLSVLLGACEGLRRAAGGGEIPADVLARGVGEVIAAAEQADTEYLLEEIPKAISHSLEGLQRMAKIVRSMKEFSHPGGEEKQAVDFNQAIESTLTVSRNEWKYVAEAVTDFDPDLPLVNCLPADCNQVILNLIVNAAHAIADKVGKNGEEKGTITVSTLREGGWIEIRVTDTGTGIPEEIRSKIFDPFFTTKAVGRGTGQGLAIVHSIVTEKHGGMITLETETGRGTTFIVRLPIG